MNRFLHPNDPLAGDYCPGCDADLDRERCACDRDDVVERHVELDDLETERKAA